MKKQLIAGLVIIMILTCTLCSLGVLALETFNPGTFVKEDTETDEVLQEEELANVVEEDEVSMELEKYKETEYSVFSVLEGDYELYFEDLNEVFQYLTIHDGARTENQITIITDILFDKDYTMPALSIPIEFVAQVTRNVDMNGYHLYDAYGNIVDLSTIPNLAVTDKTETITMNEEPETTIEETEPFTVLRVGVYRYKDIEGNIISEQSVSTPEELQVPEIPKIPGLDCLGWGDPEEVEEGVFELVPMYYKLGSDNSGA